VDDKSKFILTHGTYKRGCYLAMGMLPPLKFFEVLK